MKKNLLLKGIPLFNLLVAILLNAVSFSQATTDFNYNTPVLESGIAGEDGARYRFTKVIGNIDAVVEIKGRSSIAVVLSSIDTTGEGLGYNKSFQPVLGIPGTTPSNSEWWMDFRMEFFQSGTNISTVLPLFSATGIDIDGDGVSISEWAEMHNIQSIDTSVVNSLSFTSLSSYNDGYHYRISGIIANSPGIDISATNVMATYNYLNRDKIDFRIGATSSTSTSSAGMRLNSVWFKQFFGTPLQVQLTMFQGSKNKNNVLLQWKVSINESTNKFEIERSNDGKIFKTSSVFFGTEKNGNETYNYNEVNEDAKVYYRLKMFDKNDVLSYSKILVFNTSDKTINNLDIIGNIVTDKLTVSFQYEASNAVELCVLDMNGRIMMKQKLQAQKGNNVANISLPSSVNSGMYIALISSDNTNSSAKFIKQ